MDRTSLDEKRPLGTDKQGDAERSASNPAELIDIHSYKGALLHTIKMVAARVHIEGAG